MNGSQVFFAGAALHIVNRQQHITQGLNGH